MLLRHQMADSKHNWNSIPQAVLDNLASKQQIYFHLFLVMERISS